MIPQLGIEQVAKLSAAVAEAQASYLKKSLTFRLLANILRANFKRAESHELLPFIRILAISASNQGSTNCSFFTISFQRGFPT